MKKLRAKTVTSRSVCAKHQLRRTVAFSLFALLFSIFTPVVFTASNPAAAASTSNNNDKLKPTDPYALIFGTVWGPDDRPVYGIKVEIRRATGKKPHWQLYSDHSGEFAQRVPAGEADYVIWAEPKGVKTKDGRPLHLKEQVTVHVEYDERVDMSLHLVD